MKKCPKCGRFMEIDSAYFDEKDNHFFCNHCDMFYCFENGCYCCDGENVVMVKTMSKNKPVDIMNDDKILSLASKYAFFRDFYSWIKGNHPEICEEYLKILKENDDLVSEDEYEEMS